jgi:hypothetical protein
VKWNGPLPALPESVPAKKKTSSDLTLYTTI